MRACEILPQSASLDGENKCRKITSITHNNMLQAAYIGLITNIMIMVPNSPIKAVCHVKYLKDGLKFGALANSKPKQAKFVAR